jgi:hypothetical protein
LIKSIKTSQALETSYIPGFSTMEYKTETAKKVDLLAIGDIL